jgi:2-dehydropantoate 2-reductase
VEIEITSSPGQIPKADLVIVMVKAYDTQSAIAAISSVLKPDGAVLTLQNGVGNYELLEESFKGRVLLGTTTVGAMVDDKGEYIHTGFGDTLLGEADGSVSSRAKDAARLIDRARLGSAYATDNAMGSVWSKLILNCAINAPGALLRVRNGDIPMSEHGKRLIHEIVEECLLVIERKGVKLVFEDPESKVLAVCRSTSENINSMFQDIIAGRRTEVDFINGAVAVEGEALGAQAKVNETMANMIKALEATRERRIVN